ncbi:Para-nitrophenol 4-monooxygenase [Venturia nashicola]|nr:Para-nitrophenol 4-monooxygenase [Venturia nashicola]
MLPGHPSAKDDQIMNNNPYKVHQRLAESMKVGRFLSASDAAHLCNPLQGKTYIVIRIMLIFPTQWRPGIDRWYRGCWQSLRLLDRDLQQRNKATDDILVKYSEVRRDTYTKVIDPVSSENIRRMFDDPETIIERDDFMKMCKRAEKDCELACEIQMSANAIKYAIIVGERIHKHPLSISVNQAALLLSPPRHISIHQSDAIVCKTGCNLFLLLVQVLVVILEQGSKIDEVACFTLKDPSQGIPASDCESNLLITEPPPILTALFALVLIPSIPAIPPDAEEDGVELPALAGGDELDPIPAITPDAEEGGLESSALPPVPPDAEDGGVGSSAAAGGDELDPADGGTVEVPFDPALEDVLLDPDVEPAPAVELEALESGVAGAGGEALESGVAGAGGEELDPGVVAAGLDELEVGAELDDPLPTPGRRLPMLSGRYALSFSRNAENIDFKTDVALDASRASGLPPDAVPAPAPELSADGGEAPLDANDASLDGISG